MMKYRWRLLEDAYADTVPTSATDNHRRFQGSWSSGVSARFASDQTKFDHRASNVIGSIDHRASNASPTSLSSEHKHC
jgi:hypothetical protein